ncbi:MAG: leucine-rich repeat protein [Ruminococcus sp.]
MKQWKRLAALSSAIVMAAATLTYFPNDTLQNIRLEISASADETGADETSAATWTKTESDGLTWTLDYDGKLTISGTGAMKDYDYNNNQSPVYMNSSVKKVVIEDGVTSIGNWAFYKCTSLTTITIPDSVTSIGDWAFYKCTSLTTITIPDSVTSIGEAAFRGCSSLTSITIPDSVTSIGDAAFSHCSNLKSITIPDSITSIGKYAFCNCSSLTSITIPNSVTSIGESALAGCVNLTSITIPKSVTSIGSGVFDGCNNLTVYLESGSTLTSNDLGVNESKIGSYWVEDNLTWKLDADGTLTISGTGAMKDYDYNNNPSPANQKKGSVKKVVIKDGVTSIGKYAFCNCSNLKSITILDSVTSIGDFAFSDCSSLTSITIPDSVTSIGDFAFSGCSSLTSITIPDSVTSITIPDSVTRIGDFAFSGCSSLTSITIPDSVTSIGDDAFSYCRSLTSITIPDSVTSIGNLAFYDCSGLTSITIPNGVTSIGESAFSYCRSLTSITIPDSVTSIGDAAFKYCSNLKTISLSCKSSLKKSDFGDQANLVSYTLHTLKKTEAKAATCSEDGNKEYWTCEHCGKYFLSDDTNPETAKAVEQSECMIPAIQHKNAIIRGAVEPTETNPGYSGDLYCPDCDKVVEKGYTYWIEDNLTWKLYEDGTLNISGTGAMKNYGYSNNQSPVYWNTNVKKVVIEDGVTSIGNEAFHLCRNLISITIPKTLKSIGNNAFYDCTSLTSVTIPGNVESIGESAFYYCDNLTDVTLQDGVKSIGDAAFIWCNNLTNIVLPNSVTSIGYYAFKDCTSLTSIKIPDSVTSIGNDAFKNCSSLKTISLSCKSSLKRSNFGEQADLVSYTSHTLTKTEAKAATCTEDGNKEYWTCEHCGKYFLSDDTNPETATAVELSETVIPASHKLTKVEAKAATCTEDGNKAYWTCEHCKKYFLSDDSNPETAKAVEQSETVIPASHKLTKVEAKDATCTEDGNKEYWTCEHCKKYFLSDDTNPETATAVELSETVIPASHKLTKVEAKDATCTEDGNKAYWTCEHCKKYFLSDDSNPETAKAVEQSETVIPASHKLTKVEAKAATCTEDGNKEYWTCEHCKKYFLSDDTNPKTAKAVEFSETVIPASHKLTKVEAKDATCTEDGNKEYWTCEHCKKYFLSDDTNPETAKAVELSETVISASHKLTKVEAKAATYAENGNKAYWTCEHCKKYFLSDDTNPETATAVELSETVIPALVQVATTTTPIKCVYGQDMNKIDLRDYVKNTDVVGEVTVKVATGSTLPDGMKLDNGKISGKPAKAYEDSKEVTFTFTAENGSTENLTLLFLVAKADPTVEVSVSGDSHTEGDLVSELKLILSENSTKGVVELVSEIKALVAGKNTFTWKFTPEDENNYHTVTGTVVVNAQTTTTTTTTTKATITTTKATTTTKPNKTTTTNATTTTKPSKTTTTKVTTTTKPNKTTTTNATTTTKPSKTTTTKVTTTTKPSKTTTTKVTTTTKPSKTTTTKVTTTTKPSKTTTTKVTTTTKPSKTTTTNATTTTKPSKTTTTNATTTNTAIPSYGDVNLDGKVDIVDAIFLNKYLATLIQFSDAQVANADCYQDGVLNDQDTTALMQFIILLIDDLPVQPTEK